MKKDVRGHIKETGKKNLDECVMVAQNYTDAHSDNSKRNPDSKKPDFKSKTAKIHDYKSNSDSSKDRNMHDQEKPNSGKTFFQKPKESENKQGDLKSIVRHHCGKSGHKKASYWKLHGNPLNTAACIEIGKRSDSEILLVSHIFRTTRSNNLETTELSLMAL